MNFDEYKVNIPFPYERDFKIKKRIVTDDGNAPYDDWITDTDAYNKAKIKYYEEIDIVDNKRMNDILLEIGISNHQKKDQMLKFLDNYCDHLSWESYYDCLKELSELIQNR